MTRSKAVFGVLAAALLISIHASGAVPADAADFRVQSRVYAADSKQPISQNITLFHGSVVYDFVENGGEITVFDTESGLLTVLDTTRQLKTEVTTDQVLQYTSWLKDVVRHGDDALLKFCLQPNFQITAGTTQRRWVFDTPTMTYEVATASPRGSKVASQYRHFCDWYARLNCIFHPQSLPPFPRLTVNERLSRQDLVPKAVYLRIAPQRRFGNQETKIHSLHDFRYELTEADIARINRASTLVTTYEKVPLNRYRDR